MQAQSMLDLCEGDQYSPHSPSAALTSTPRHGLGQRRGPVLAFHKAAGPWELLRLPTAVGPSCSAGPLGGCWGQLSAALEGALPGLSGRTKNTSRHAYIDLFTAR